MPDTPDTVADYPAPLLIRATGMVPSFTISEATRFIAKPGQDLTAIHNRLKGAVQRRLIHSRQEEDARRTSPLYLGIDDLAVAVGVIFPLLDTGIADSAVVGPATLAAYSWDGQQNPKPAYLPKGVSPIVGALVGAARGQCWILQVTAHHHLETDARRIVATVYDMDVPPPDPSNYLDPAYLPRTTLMTHLGPLLLPLNRAFEPQVVH